MRSHEPDPPQDAVAVVRCLSHALGPPQNNTEATDACLLSGNQSSTSVDGVSFNYQTSRHCTITTFSITIKLAQVYIRNLSRKAKNPGSTRMATSTKACATVIKTTVLILERYREGPVESFYNILMFPGMTIVDISQGLHEIY